MSSFSDFLLPIVQKVNMYLSDYILIVLLIGAGLFYTFKTKFVQIRCFNEGMKNLFSKQKESQKGMSPFQALATAIAAQVGTGNIVGACGAILIGGPGAIFWMWIIAFFGMATIYAEAVLAQETRTHDENGELVGTLEDILETPASSVYIVRGETEHMIPAVPEFVLKTDAENGIITVRLIEGM